MSTNSTLALAIQLHKAGNLKRAEVLYKQMLRESPNDAHLWHLVGGTAYQTGNYKDALHYFLNAITIDPTNSEIYHDLGNTLIVLKRIDCAVDAFRKALHIKPNESKNYKGIGIAFYLKGKINSAVEALQHAVNLNSNDADSLYVLGTALTAQGKLRKAVSAFRQAVSINSNDAESYFNLGRNLASLSKKREAVEAYKCALSKNPDHAEAHHNLGLVLYSLNKFKEAELYFKRTLELDPSDLAAKHLLNALTGKTSEKAPEHYVQCLFDRYATNFEYQVLKKLDYRIPDILKKSLGAFAQKGLRFQNALDLGCGTGLAGREIRFIAERLCGVDISQKMIDKAEKKNIYDKLVISNIVQFLNHTNEKYDLIVAADVFIYFGNLELVFNLVSNCLLSGAYFIFTTESTALKEYVLRKSGRFAHSKGYIQGIAETNGFLIEDCISTGIRKENKNWINGDIFILKYR